MPMIPFRQKIESIVENINIINSRIPESKLNIIYNALMAYLSGQIFFIS